MTTQSVFQVAIAALKKALQEGGPGNSQCYQAAVSHLVSVENAVLSHDRKMDAEERCPTGDDYNDLMDYLGVSGQAPEAPGDVRVAVYSDGKLTEHVGQVVDDLVIGPKGLTWGLMIHNNSHAVQCALVMIHEGQYLSSRWFDEDLGVLERAYVITQASSEDLKRLDLLDSDVPFGATVETEVGDVLVADAHGHFSLNGETYRSLSDLPVAFTYKCAVKPVLSAPAD